MVQLYHSTPYPDTFTVINPGTRNVAINETAGGPVADMVEYDDANTPYVYASDNRQSSATYAITKGVRLGNASLPGGEIVYIEQENIIGDPELKGGIYSFKSDDFMQLHIDGQLTNQHVSAHSVDLTKAEYHPLRSLNDIMQTGVQVLQLADNTNYTSYDFYQETIAAKDDAAFSALIQAKMKSGDLRWLNEERGIKPSDPFVKSDVVRASHAVPGDKPGMAP